MKKQHIVGGVFIIILGIIIYLSCTSYWPFNAYQICNQFDFLRPCTEKIELLTWISIILVLFGIADFIYGLLSSYEKIKKTKYIEEVERVVYVRCPRCGARNKEGVRYCTECGEPLMPRGRAEAGVEKQEKPFGEEEYEQN